MFSSFKSFYILFLLPPSPNTIQYSYSRFNIPPIPQSFNIPYLHLLNMRLLPDHQPCRDFRQDAVVELADAGGLVVVGECAAAVAGVAAVAGGVTCVAPIMTRKGRRGPFVPGLATREAPSAHF